MIKTIIFDMDGTILNTLDDLYFSVNYALKKLRLKEKTKDEVRLAVGRGALNLIKAVVPNNSSDQEIDLVYKTYQDYYDIHSKDHTKPYPYILDVLKQLKKDGYQLGVVSNKHEYLVEALNQDVFEGIFDISIGQTKDIPIKPAPDMLYKGIKLLNSSIEDSIFIGDSDTDMLTAKNANIKSIGVTWGFRTKKVLEDIGATYIIDHPHDIIKIIKGEYDG